MGSFDHPVIGEKLVYISGSDGYLYALDKDTSDLIWEVAVGDEQDPQPLIAGPVLDPDRDIIIVGSEDGNLYAFDAANGGPELWSFPTGDRIWSTPVIKDGIIYFGSHDKNVYAVRLDDQTEKWRFQTGGSVAGRPLLFRNLVVVGSFDKKLYGIDAGRGTKRWELEGENWFWAGAVANERTIFAPSMDGNIYAVDRNGGLLWKHDLGSAIVSRPVVMSGMLAVAARKSREIVLLDTSPAPMGADREISRAFIGDAEVRAPLFAQGNTLYVGTEDGDVVRLDLEKNRAGRLGLDKSWCFNTEDDGECENR